MYHARKGRKGIMAKKEEEKKPKKATKKAAEVVEETTEEISEAEILKQAEEKEKERKEKEEEEKKEAKAAEKEHKVSEKKEKEEVKQQRRSRLARKSKKYRAVHEKIEKDMAYEIFDAIKLAKETTVTKFDSSIEVHIRIDKKIQNTRGTITLPGGAVKEKNVLAVDDKNIEEVMAKVKAGKIDFDIMIATPAMMPKLAQLAKVLGPKGLMPNPKAGTVAENLDEALEDFKGGKVEFKADKGNIVHMVIGKVSTEDAKIKENFDALLAAMPSNKVVSVYLTTTMGPSVPVKTK